MVLLTTLDSSRNSNHITWVTNTKVKPNRIIYCKNCDGYICFNLEELLECKNRGQNTSTPCRFCSYHPNFPPEPYIEFTDGFIEINGKKLYLFVD